MKLLNVNKFYYLRGGAERYYFALAKLMQDHGHDVIPFSMKDKRNLDSEWSKYFVSNLELGNPTMGMASQFERSIWSYQSKKQLTRLLDKVTPDLAHIHLIYHHISPSILPLLSKRGIPTVMTLHDYKLVSPDYILYCKGQPYKPSFINNYVKTITNKCLKNSYAVSTAAVIEFAFHKMLQVYEKHIDLFISPSEAVKTICVEAGIDEQKIVVIPHFLDQNFLELANKASAPKKKKPYLLYFGRLSREKGIDKILQMLYIYKMQIPLKIAGSGPLQPTLEAYIKEKGLGDLVEFTGHLEPSELVTLIQESACVIIPSQFYEPFGFTALEAMALGAPVVVSDRGALPDIVPDHLGKVFPAEDRKALGLAVKEVMTWDRKKLRKDARAYIAKYHMPDQHYKSLMTVYKHLMK